MQKCKVQFSLESAVQYVKYIEGVYNIMKAYEGKGYASINHKYDYINNQLEESNSGRVLFSILNFAPDNVYPDEDDLRLERDDLWYMYPGRDKPMDDALLEIKYSTEPLTPELWFQYSTLHEEIDIFFYAIYKMLYENGVLKNHVYFYFQQMKNVYESFYPTEPVS